MHCSRIQLKHARWTMNTQHLRSFCANLRSIRADVCHRLSIIMQIVPSVRIVCGHWWIFHPLFRRGNHLRDFSWVEVIIVSVYIFDTERKYSHSLMSLSMYFSAKFFVLRFTIRSREYCRRRDEIHCIKSAIIVLKKILIPTIQPVFPSMVAPFVATTTKYKQLKHIFSVVKHFIPSLGLLYNNSYESDLNHFENKWSMHVTGSMILGNRMHFACFL